MQLTQSSNRTVRTTAIRFNAWTSRRRTELPALFHLSGFALTFGGVAHATYHSALAQSAQASCGETCLAMPGFYALGAAACGGVAVLAMLVYAAVLRALGRQPSIADGDWVLLATGIVLVNCDALFGAQGYLRLEFYVAWTVAGIGVLDFFWLRFAAGRTEKGGAG